MSTAEEGRNGRDALVVAVTGQSSALPSLVTMPPRAPLRLGRPRLLVRAGEMVGTTEGFMGAAAGSAARSL
eukprot:3060075-Rhodomonas_salina.2